jgi:hypothetical protein
MRGNFAGAWDVIQQGGKDAFHGVADAATSESGLAKITPFLDRLRDGAAGADQKTADLAATFEKTNAAALRAKAGVTELSEAEAKLQEQAQKIIDQQALQADPGLKYEREVQVLRDANAQKLIADGEYHTARETLEQQAENARGERRQREIDALLDKNTQLRQLNDVFYSEEIEANNAKLEKLLAQEASGSDRALKIRVRLAAEEKKIDQQRLQGVQGFLGAVAGTFDKHTAAYKVSATAKALISALLGAQQAATAVSSIPFVGPVLAGAAYAAFLAQGIATVAKINGVNLATGLTEVPPGFPSDSFPANLTSGERVVNVSQNSDLVGMIDEFRGVRPLLAAILAKLDDLAVRPIIGVMDGDVLFRSVDNRLRDGRAFAA